MKDKYTLDIFLCKKYFFEGEARGLQDLLTNLRNLVHSPIINEMHGVHELSRDILNRIEELENPKPKELKLEVGKFYRTRDGEKIYKIIYQIKSCSDSVISSNCTFVGIVVSCKYEFDIDTISLFEPNGSEEDCSSFDLVKEVTEECVKEFGKPE